ncbi:MAE_28990/MAE_18760 family HEPN-like nuclease [Pseudomonas sp. AS2.8]|uniref:MAE_28990/MAE_18760 family HEPN-like nuclease n=1 Tax=Pseudomonas sp. AS2.8 TaxID=2587128 RepID=UPI00161DEFB5|nr:MAE_28990/MAE_18760 family HEPN-like nuclease [Pseudomonas sp. AS2.8]MBB2896991.1 hypothetical protein [Pseudomonas sp. AS2.8]
MFDKIKEDVAARLAEVFTLIGLIKANESPMPMQDSAEVKILRGLFYVHLYSSLEFCVNKGVERYLQGLNSLNVVPAHFELQALTFVLANEFSSLRDVGEDKKWVKRLELISSQSSIVVGRVNDGLFGLYLQNVWPERLEVLFACLGISLPIVPDPSYRLHLEEVVDKRNSIAHGRFSAMGIGGSRRSPELESRLKAVNDTCFYFLDCLEAHYQERGSIKPAHRSAYE